MKKILLSVVMIAVSSAVIPAVPACLQGNTAHMHSSDVPEVALKEYIFDETDISAESYAEPYRVLDISSGQVLEVPVRDYVIGAVCAEMPASFETEALKAQALQNKMTLPPNFAELISQMIRRFIKDISLTVRLKTVSAIIMGSTIPK